MPVLTQSTIRFWRAHNAHLLKAAEQESQLASLRAAYAADSSILEQLERTNVYNDAFCIGHDGVFGTINGLRLGRVPSVPVRLLRDPCFALRSPSSVGRMGGDQRCLGADSPPSVYNCEETGLHLRRVNPRFI